MVALSQRWRWIGVVALLIMGSTAGCSSDEDAVSSTQEAEDMEFAGEETAQEDADGENSVDEGGEPSLSYTIESGGEETVVVANIGIRCVAVTPGQVYLTGTYYATETLSSVNFAIEVGAPIDDGSPMEIVGLYTTGADAPAGEALVAWEGPGEEQTIEDAGGWISFTRLDPCKGEFRVEAVTESGENFVLKDGSFAVPLEFP